MDITPPTPPKLGRSPRADNVGITSVTVSWDAWGTYAEDTGDGPVVAYNVYNVGSPTVVATVAVSPTQPQTVYSTVVGDLTPNMLYRFYVTVIREGANGEGPPSKFVEVTTLPVTTQPTTTTNPPTTTKPTTQPKTNQVETTMKMTTTMKASKTDPIVIDRTTPSARRTIESDTLASRTTKRTGRVPNPPLDVSTVTIGATRITLGWNDPEGSNRDILLYHVSM
ncbi:uncharacterized protein [Amphiura filiformis]|uniref:uncharacterized protein n=1 Tax=Amphiura filiformis TaxID=82378 RepID=UPI003B20BC26